VTHDRHEAALLADTVAVLLNGRVAQHGTPVEVHARPASLAVHRLLGGRNAVPGTVVDGTHRSALGRLPLPCADGAARADGPGVLVVRQESVRVVPADADADVVGTVSAVRSLGAITAVQVTVEGVELEAQVPAGLPETRPGTRVGLALPVEQRHVVASPGTGPTAPGGSTPGEALAYGDVSRSVDGPRPA
jgi:putative spermidine/putrescine transport system ATP-binding protein